MAKEKFELVFLAGGTLLNVLTNRLRRAPATPREEVGAAMHELARACTGYPERLAEPAAVHRQLGAVRAALSAARPDPLLVDGYLAELGAQVGDAAEFAEPVARLRTAVRGYLG